MYVLFTNVFPGGRGKRTESFFHTLLERLAKALSILFKNFDRKLKN